MNRTLQLQQDRAARLDEAKAILTAAQKDNRAMTVEERSALETKETEVEALTATLDAEQRMAALSNIHTDKTSGAPHAGSSQTRIEVHDNFLDKPFGYEARGSETPQERRRRMEYGLGEQLMAVVDATKKQSMGQKGDARLYELQERAVAAGASEAVPADGGFLIQPDFAQEILYLAHETGLVYPRARSLPMSEFTNAMKIPAVDEQSRADGQRFGGVRMFWENEADALIGSKPKFALIELITKKLTGLYYATSEVLADARLMGSVVLMAFGQELGFKMDDAVIRGTGSGQPLGILNSNALVTVNKETGQVATTIVFENIKKMWKRMWAPSRKNAVWFYNQDTEDQFFGLSQVVGVGGLPVFLPPGGASASPYSTLFGRPMLPIEQCDTLGNLGDVILADVSQYLLVDKGPMQTAVSVHVRFLTDEQTFRWIYRTDGSPWWKTALTPAHGTLTLSPFVALQAR